MADYTGTISDDTMAGGAGDESFDYSQGGDDTLTGGAGFDNFTFGAALNAQDSIDGGADSDAIYISGDYTAGVFLASTTFQNIESFVVNGGQGAVHLAEGNVASGATLTVNLMSATSFTFDASALLTGSVGYNAHLTEGHLSGGANPDNFNMWNGLDRKTVLDGGANVGGQDLLSLLSDLTLHAADHTLRNIEFISTNSNLDLVLADGNVAEGATLTFIAAPAGMTIVVDGHKETDGYLHLLGGGNTSTFHFIGGHLEDLLSGGSGADTLAGGAGQDDLTGGGGSDVFVYHSAGESRRAAPDVIHDLGDDDLIDLIQVDADKTTAGKQMFTLVESFSGHAGELTLHYEGDSDTTRLEGDIDGDGKAEFLVVIDDNHEDFTGLVLGA